MIKTKTVKKEVEVFDVFICDKCGNEITGIGELQETYSIDFFGGYSSVFGVGVH